MLVLLVVASAAHAQTAPKPQSSVRLRGADGIYLAVAAMGGAHDAPLAHESRLPLLTLDWLGNSTPLHVGAQVAVGNQPRASRALLFSGSLSF